MLPTRSSRVGPIPPAALPPRVTGPNGSALGLMAGGGVTIVGHLVGVGGYPEVGLALLALATLAVGAGTTVPGALACAAQAWGMYSGFWLHGLGELRLDRPSVTGLVVLVLLGVSASALALLVRAVAEVLARRGEGGTVFGPDGGYRLSPWLRAPGPAGPGG